MIKNLKRVISMVLVVIMVTAMMPMSVISTSAATVEGESVGLSGSGTSSSPYLIGTVNDYKQFVTLANSNPSVCGKLTANIQLNSYSLNSSTLIPPWGTVTVYSYTPIGTSSKPYAGTFDGAGYTINGFYYSNGSPSGGLYAGVFGYVGSTGVIKNLSLTNTYVSAYSHAGALCGVNNGTIENCHARRSKTITTGDYCGGICGFNNNGSISKCTVNGLQLSGGGTYTGGICGRNSKTVKSCTVGGYDCSSSISGKYYVGGICGNNSGGIVSRCSNSLNVTATVNAAGGICGMLTNDGTITDCYAAYCSVTATDYGAGGICGNVNNSSGNTVTNCFYYNTASGIIFAPYYVGSIFGRFAAGTYSYCYYIKDTAVDENGSEQNGIGVDTPGKWQNDNFSMDLEEMSIDEFKSGEVAWLLNKGVTDGSQAFYQTVDSTNYPNFSGKTVYGGYKTCTSTTFLYSNSPLNETMYAHAYENGFCVGCDRYEEALDTDNDGYVEIDNGGKLYWFASQVNSGKTTLNAELTKDIFVNQNVLNSNGELNNGTYRAWTPIGNSSVTYAGAFKGQNHTISGLYYNTSSSYIGLFGKVGTNGVVDSVGLINSYIKAGSYVGGIAGYNYGTIKNCSNASTISGSSYVGGIAGYNYGTIKNCSNASTISGSSYVGGIIGFNKGNTITNCHNTGNVSGNGRSVGGVIGENNRENATITNCSNTGNISGSNYVGGIIGFSKPATITNCYNTGDVTGNGCDSANYTGAGGIVGANLYNNPITITNCYNTGSITAKEIASGGIIGSANKATITNCSNTGDISAANYAGGIIAASPSAHLKITNCYNIGNVSGETYVGSIAGVITSEDTITNCYYLENTATDGNGIKQFGVGNATAGSTTADKSGQTVKKTLAQFKSGEVTYLLNNKSTASSAVWKQTIGTNNYPLFTGKTVYYGYVNCGSSATYSNTNLSTTKPAHNYVNGFCKVCDAYQPATDSDGDGYYEIDNGGKLYWFAAQVNGGNTTLKAKLTANITVNSNVVTDGVLSSNTSSFRKWIQIGNKEYTNDYAGIFDGNGKYISGIYHPATSRHAGLVGRTKNTSTIKNLTIKDSYFSNTAIRVAAFVGCSWGTVSNCHVEDSLISGRGAVAGIVADNEGTVTNCSNKAAIVNALSDTGGIVAANYGDVKLCYNSGTITSGSDSYEGLRVGGVVGNNASDSNIENCYNVGTVDGDDRQTGGIVGIMQSTGAVKNCHNYGTVSGLTYVGSICGEKTAGTITNCYYLENKATDGNSVKQNGVGNATAGSTTADTSSQTVKKTATRFKSGEVAYYLNGKTATSSSVWRQTVNSNSYPTFSGSIVYYGYANCGSSATYSNTNLSTTKPAHNYVNGFCQVCDAYEPAIDSDGDGYYEIDNGGKLYWFASQVNSGKTTLNAELTKDIYVNQNVLNSEGELNSGTYREWKPIGFNRNYLGTFNGQNHTISGLYYNTSSSYIGLFGKVGTNGVVDSVGLINSYIKAGSYVGGIAGYNYGTIKNCSNSSTISGSSYVGGIIGFNEGNTITNCHNTGNINGNGRSVSGIIGENKMDNATITNCSNTGNISGGRYVGGIIGISCTATITNCYNTGDVTGNGYDSVNHTGAGGIVGGNTYNLPITITNCYNTGNIMSTRLASGGIIGSSNKFIITDCYNTGDISAANYAGGIAGLINTSPAKITSCYNIGNVSGKTYVGSIAGEKTSSDTITNCYYLEGTAINNNGIVQNGVGNATTGSTTADVEGQTISKTSEQFASGEVAYLLNSEVTDGTQAWYQTIGTDKTPLFEGKTVYYGYSDCIHISYSNTPLSETPLDHIYDNGFCKVCDVYEPATDSDGDGYVEIDNGGKLYWFSEQVNGGNTTLNAELTKDIYVNQNVLNSNGELNSGTYREWKPIGNDSVKYSGIFDGGNYTVSGLYFKDTTVKYVGLFGQTASGSEIKNVGVIGSYFEAKQDMGAVVGVCYGTITNCYNTSSVISTGNYIGGVCGHLLAGSITECYNTGTVYGAASVGGVVGNNDNDYANGIHTRVTKCYNTGTVNGNANTGGITGYNRGGIVNNCYNFGTVNGKGSSIGGVSGYMYAFGGVAEITNCYSTGTVNGSRFVGSVCGEQGNGTITNCYYLENTAKDSNGTVQFGVGNATAGSTTADVAGATEKKTLAQFKSGEVTYLLNNGVTDGTQAWYQTIGTDDYPLFTGKTVYAGYKDCLADISYSNENPEYTERPNHNFVDGTCEICGEVLAELKAANLTLDGMIGVNLYINFSDIVYEDENPILTVNVPQGTQVDKEYVEHYETFEITVNEEVFENEYVSFERHSEDLYKLTCWISAKEMTAPITAQLKLSDGTLSKTMTYTVKQYGDTIFDSKYGSTYDSQKDIVKSLLNYGAYAQQYFDYRIDELPNTGDYFTDEERTAPVISGDDRTDFINNNALALNKGTEDKVKYYGSSMLFKDDLVIRHYFTLVDSSVDANTLTVTVDGKNATIEQKGSLYYVDIKGIPAYNLDEKYSVCIDTMTIEYSCMSYVASVLKAYTNENGACTNESKQTLVNLVTTLYEYSQSTKAYTGK